MFDITKQVDHWQNGAKESLDDAQYLIKDGRVTLGLFALHLALEKAVKAHVIKETKEMPPRIHNLLTLANLASLTLTSEQEQLLSELNTFNIRGRYPDIPIKVPSLQEAKLILEQSEDFYEWLIKLL